MKQFVSSDRKFDKRIKRKPLSIPKIQDLLFKQERFEHNSSLDLNVDYYHIKLCPF